MYLPLLRDWENDQIIPKIGFDGADAD